MQLIENGIYHIYNQGNNRNQIFFRRENQLYFLAKFRKYVLPHTEVLAYCLMPNHFHFMLYTTSNSVKEKKVGGLMLTELSNGFRQLLSSYSQAINKQENRSGSLFRQKTKAKLLDDQGGDYPFTCFHYIHQNPLHAGLVEKMEDWEFSSFKDYLGTRNGSLCNKALTLQLLDISKKEFYQASYQVIAPEKIHELF